MVINGSTSAWQPVINRVPQGSILGLILFNIFISYLGDETEHTLSKSVDSTKLGRMTDTANSRGPIQRDPEKLEDAPAETPWSSTRSAKLCMWVIITLVISPGWELMDCQGKHSLRAHSHPE